MAEPAARKLSRRRLLALSAAGVAALPPLAAASADPSPLAALIDRHKSAAAALDTACGELDRAARRVARRHSADIRRAWLRETKGGTRLAWPAVRKTHGIDGLEQRRRELDAAEREAALALLGHPCRSLEEVQLKAGYVRQADILVEHFVRDERFIEALLGSMTG